MSRSQTGCVVHTWCCLTLVSQDLLEARQPKFVLNCSAHGWAACCVSEFADHVPTQCNQSSLVASTSRPGGIVIYELDRSRRGNRSDMIVLVGLRRCCSVDLPSRARRRSFAGDMCVVCPAPLQHECVILLELPSQAAATRTGPWRRRAGLCNLGPIALMKARGEAPGGRW